MTRKAIFVGCAAWACLGMICTGPDGPDPTLPEVKVREIRMLVLDPETGKVGVFLSWSRPEGGKASHFEIYQSLRRDSLGRPVQQLPAAESTATLRLPDTNSSHTFYYGVRAVQVEPTGQKLYGKSIPVDSLTVRPSLEILAPTPRSRQGERVMEVEVKTSSDDGIILRQFLYGKGAGGWSRQLDTCLPMQACGIPVFGNTMQRDALVLQSLPAGDSVESLFCVLGEETFEESSTGRKQSLGCSRFFRVGP